MPKLNFNFCYSINTSSKRVRRTVIANVSSGIVPPDVIQPEVVVKGVPEKVLDLVSKLDNFTGKLKAVPDEKAADYASIVEANNEMVWAFATDQAKKNLIGKVNGFTGDVAIMFQHTNYVKIGDSNPYTVAMVNCRKVFARGAWANFWAAVSIKVQAFRDKEQRIDPDLGYTSDEFAEIKDNLVYIGKGFAYNARTTSAAKYIDGTALAVKREDAAAFNAWYVKKAHTLVKIARLNVSDIPFGYAPKEITDFEMDPTNDAYRTGLLSKLLSLQKEGLTEWRARKQAGTQASFDFEAWLAAK